jgi:hypothetical protein
MLVLSPRTQNQGVNIVIRNHGTTLPYGGDVERIIQDPQGLGEPFRYDELQRGGNRVLAALDLVLKDVHVDPTGAIIEALRGFERAHRFTAIPNPLRLPSLPLPNGGELQGQFMTNFGHPDTILSRAVFKRFTDTLERAFERYRARPAA